MLGRPDWTVSKCTALSERETVEALTNLPDDLLELVKSHYGLSGAAETPVIQTVDESTNHKVLLTDDVNLNDEDEKTVEKSDLKKLSVKELKENAKLLEIKGYSKLNEDELIEAIYQKLGEA